MTKRIFAGSFTQQESIPDEAIEAAIAVLRSGRLHRYNVAQGETAEVSLLEREFADWQGSKYCLSLASGGQAMQIAMRAGGVKTGDNVLTNAFTLAPVPGAIEAVGAKSVLVEVDTTLRIDFADLEQKIASSKAGWLLLSHMRGHKCDMDRLMAITNAAGITVIEDCAHTMGARWNGIRSGNFGLAGCFSSQTYKHINSGEGGLLTSDDPDFMARAIILSGSYMLYGRHGAAPDQSHFEQPRLNMPNLSARMDNLRAAILRPQIANIDANVERWNARYRTMVSALAVSPMVNTVQRPLQEHMVGSSIQFHVPSFDASACRDFLDEASKRGVEIKWFGAKEPLGFTSSHRSWRYMPTHQLPQTDAILAALFDMRLPLTFSQAECAAVGEIICNVIDDMSV